MNSKFAAILFVIAFSAGCVSNEPAALPLVNEPQIAQPAGVPSCGDKKELFTVSHIPVSELQNIIPLGNLNPPAHTFPTNHLYFHLKGFRGDFLDNTAPAVAPVDIWITRIRSSEYTMRGQRIKDYKLDFTVCAEVTGYFIHLASLSEKLLQEFGQPETCEEYDTAGIHYKNCGNNFYLSPIKIAAGEPIGTVGGSSDFGLADLRTPELVYANRNRWEDEPLHRVCPLDYFAADLRVQLRSLLGSSDTKRKMEPTCGQVAQDMAGTAQGVWFVKGTGNTYPEDTHISLVHDNIDPQKGAFSVGTSMSKSGIVSGTYYFAPQNSGTVNRDFKDVTPDGKVYCYRVSGRYGGAAAILVQLLNSNTIRIEGTSGCGSAFTDKYTDFER